MLIDKMAINIIKGCAYLLLFLVLVFPMVSKFLYIKAFLFLILLMIVLIVSFKTHHLSLHPHVLLLAIFFFSVGLLYSFEGLIADASSFFKQAQVYAFWPMVYILLISRVSLTMMHGLRRTLIFSTYCIAIYGLVYFITQIGLLPYVFDLDYFDEESAITFNEGYVRMRFMGLNSLPYLIPYIMTEIISPSIEPNKQLRSRLWLWLALILGLSLVILSGRRVTLLITLLSPLIVYLFSLYSPNQLHKRINRNIIVLSIAAIVLIYVLLFYLDIHFGVNLSTLYNMLSEGFNFGTAVGTAESEGAFVRREQFYALINGWLDNPFFGAGLGTFAPGYIRNPEMPWAYELSYVALLYQVGLVGILIYAGGILWIFYMGVKIMKQEEYLGSMMLPLLVGMTCYLIANITNPYLVRFDGIWVIFLPIALINRWLLSEHKDEPAKYSPIK